jgi:hypothetical protein
MLETGHNSDNTDNQDDPMGDPDDFCIYCKMNVPKACNDPTRCVNMRTHIVNLST